MISLPALLVLHLLTFTPGILDPLPTPASPPLFPGVRSLLWVGAHPDDEVLVAPVTTLQWHLLGLPLALAILAFGWRKIETR